MIKKTMNDYIFERRVFIRESIIMRKRLIKFQRYYSCLMMKSAICIIN